MILHSIAYWTIPIMSIRMYPLWMTFTDPFIVQLMQDKQSPIDIAHDCVNPKAIKVLTKPKYGCISLPWSKRSTKMRSSHSSSGISSHRSESTNSVNSFASSACSEITPRYNSRSKR